MKIHRVCSLLTPVAGGLLLGLLINSSHAQKKLPLDTFFQPAAIARPQLSPDGSKIAFLVPVEQKMALGYIDRKTQEANLVVRGTDENLLSFFWKGNDHLVFMADVGGNESFFIGATDLKGKKVIRIAESSESDDFDGSIAGILNPLKNDPKHIVVNGYFTQRRLAPGEFRNLEKGLFRCDITTGDRDRLFDSLDTRIAGYLIDEAGDYRGRMIQVDGRIIYLVGRVGREESVFEFQRHGYAEDIEPIGFGPKGRRLYLISRQENDRGTLRYFDMETMELSGPLFTPPEGEIVRLILNPDRSKILGVISESDRRHYHWFDATRGKIHASLQMTFAGKDVDIVSTSDDESVMLVRASSDRDPGSYFVYDLTKGSLDPFKRILPVDESLMRPMEAISYEARDGLRIHGYLTLPYDGAENVPLIINPHGGPFGVRDSWGFQREVQFLANRGYAVLQVNYRGSGGYGREFINKGRYQWGRAMQDDLTDGVKWAIDQGYADPENVAIVGASYGGYAVLAGLTLTPDLYRCGVNYVGAADLEITFSARGQSARATDFNYRKIWVGPDKAYRDATSPVRLVDQIRVPLLNAYGENDPRVVIDHWDRLETQLKRNDIPYETIIEKEQGHGFRDIDSSKGYYQRVEEFLAKHMPSEVNR